MKLDEGRKGESEREVVGWAKEKREVGGDE